MFQDRQRGLTDEEIDKNSRWLPQELARRRLTAIRDDNVRGLWFHGPEMGYWKLREGLLVREQSFIRRFLGALRGATYASLAGGLPGRSGADVLFLVLGCEEVPVDGRDLAFPFLPWHAFTAYGPEFRAALDTLPPFVAGRARNGVGRVARQVKTIEVELTNGITQPIPRGSISQFLASAARMDERSYSCTDQEAVPCILRLWDSKGTATNIHLVVPPPRSSNTPVWQRILWQLVLPTTTRRG